MPYSRELDCCDPIQNLMDGHKGAVTGVQWVPGSSDLFLSCGTDSELHVNSYNEVSIIVVLKSNLTQIEDPKYLYCLFSVCL